MTPSRVMNLSIGRMHGRGIIKSRIASSYRMHECVPRPSATENVFRYDDDLLLPFVNEYLISRDPSFALLFVVWEVPFPRSCHEDAREEAGAARGGSSEARTTVSKEPSLRDDEQSSRGTDSRDFDIFALEFPPFDVLTRWQTRYMLARRCCVAVWDSSCNTVTPGTWQLGGPDVRKLAGIWRACVHSAGSMPKKAGRMPRIVAPWQCVREVGDWYEVLLNWEIVWYI